MGPAAMMEKKDRGEGQREGQRKRVATGQRQRGWFHPWYQSGRQKLVRETIAAARHLVVPSTIPPPQTVDFTGVMDVVSVDPTLRLRSTGSRPFFSETTVWDVVCGFAASLPVVGLNGEPLKPLRVGGYQDAWTEATRRAVRQYLVQRWRQARHTWLILYDWWRMEMLKGESWAAAKTLPDEFKIDDARKCLELDRFEQPEDRTVIPIEYQAWFKRCAEASKVIALSGDGGKACTFKTSRDLM